MKYLSVCSGIEAATVAWDQIGWSPVAFSEIEKFPAAALTHHYPGVPNHGDMTKFKEWPDYADINVLVGGTPCQSFSIAGLRKGLADPRGNLMLTYLAIAARYRPKWVVWENVPGVLSSNGGRDFGTFLAGLGQLGYGFAYRVLDAQYFGVAQRRRRVFVVGYLGDWRRAAAVLSEQNSLQGYSPPSREKGESVAGTLEASLGRSRGAGTPVAALHAEGLEIGPSGGKFTEVNPTLDMGAKDGPIRNQLAGAVLDSKDDVWPADIASTLNAAFGSKLGLENQYVNAGCPLFVPVNSNGVGSWKEGFGTLRAREQDSHENLVCEKNAIAIKLANTKSNGHCIHNELAYTMDQSNGQCVAFAENSRGEVRLEGGDGQIVGAISTGGGKPGQGCPTIAYSIMPMNSGKDYKAREVEVAQPLMAGGPVGGNQGGDFISQQMQVRRLTPRECERLQGFQDDYTLIPSYAKGSKKEDREEVARWLMRGDINMTFEQALETAGHPDGPRYKALGNSMAVPVMRWIGSRIQMVEAVNEPEG